MSSEVHQDALEQPDARHGQELLGGGVGEGAEPRALAAQEDDRSHRPVVVEVGAGLVVVVFGAVVVLLGTVVVGAVVVAAGAVVDVAGAVVVGASGVGTVVVDCPLFTRSLSMAVMAAPGGLGIDLPDGTNASVMSWPSASRTALGSVWIVGLLDP